MITLCLPLFLLATYTRDVAPILQDHCQECHRNGEIGPMPLTTYRQVRPWAKAIRDAVVTRKMPPWFADPSYGHFANDRSLTDSEIQKIAAWSEGGAVEGRASDSPAARSWPARWNIGVPDLTVTMPEPISIPASGELDYQYIIVPSGLTSDHWVSKVEIRPGDRSVVHHAVVYVREPASKWLADRPRNQRFTLGSRDPDAITRNDILFTYTPGNQWNEFPAGMAKLIPAGSDLVFQMHYTAAKTPRKDQSKIAVVFAKEPPTRRVLTLQLNYFNLFIPPGRSDYRAQVSGTLPGDALLLSLYPHMHLRGKSFEYAIYEHGQREILLKVNNYDFYWQLTYQLAQPRLLKAGTKIECVAVFDNSKNNPRNPDPDEMVRYGQQSTDEMMVGFFDIAVDAQLDKFRYFELR